MVRTFLNFKFKVLNYSKNWNLHDTLIPNLLHDLLLNGLCLDFGLHSLPSTSSWCPRSNAKPLLTVNVWTLELPSSTLQIKVHGLWCNYITENHPKNNDCKIRSIINPSFEITYCFIINLLCCILRTKPMLILAFETSYYT